MAAQVGCTAVVAVLKAGELFVANAGDSRAVLGRGDEAVALSADHKPASASEKERITNAGGFVSEVLLFFIVNGMSYTRIMLHVEQCSNGKTCDETEEQ